MKVAPEGTQLIVVLGAGSVFDVALVRDEGGRELIVKRVRAGADLVRGSDALMREAAILQACTTCHFPTLLGTGTDAGGAYVLQTRAPGRPLRAYLPLPGAPGIDAGTWSSMAASVSSALASVHGLADTAGALQVAHGDVSPDNVFYAPTAPPVFVDLSSATWRDAPEAVSVGDRGTLPYAAPELARNDGPATQASDTYALAAVLLTLAVGSICASGTAASRLLEIGTRGVLRHKIEARTDLSPRARDAIFRALAFDPRARLASSHELAEALRLEANGRP